MQEKREKNIWFTLCVVITEQKSRLISPVGDFCSGCTGWSPLVTSSTLMGGHLTRFGGEPGGCWRNWKATDDEVDEVDDAEGEILQILSSN
jgi:hypothetical protein